MIRIRIALLAFSLGALALAPNAFPLLAPMPAPQPGECITDSQCEAMYGAEDEPGDLPLALVEI